MERRNALITAASVAAVVLTGATAVGANLGILTSTDQSAFGDLNATAEVVAPPLVSPDLELSSSVSVVPLSSGTTSPGAGSRDEASLAEGTHLQQFAVDIAGVVEVEQSGQSLRLGSVEASTGWSWSASQVADGELVVTFESADSTFVFFATIEPDGSIAARVDQPITQVVSVGGVSAPSSTESPQADDHDDDHDDDDHDDDHDDDDEHEGRDDDD